MTPRKDGDFIIMYNQHEVTSTRQHHDNECCHNHEKTWADIWILFKEYLRGRFRR